MCIYGGIIAALLVINEMKAIEISLTYAYFLATYRGRNKSILNIVAGTLNLSLGLVYMIMSFIIPSFPPPNPISINWQNWKDFSAEGLDLARPKHLSVESHVAIRLKSPPPPATPQHHHVPEDDVTMNSPFRNPY
ncbi:hypothetical protein BDC45DRAFT_570530 [Circinella umbellata]|nr:hypothetical protein BDC45DRAFT_570530 [Circinella umbellata]